LLISPSFSLPPQAVTRGIEPSQAAKWTAPKTSPAGR
jgi:hypothetical protein